MFGRIIKFIVLGVLVALPLTGEVLIQFRSGAFIPSSRSFHEVYGNHNPFYELEIQRSLNRCVGGWLNFDWFAKDRHFLEEEPMRFTRIELVTISAGVKFPYQFLPKLRGSLGVGPTIARVWQRNTIDSLNEDVRTLSFGAVGKAELDYFFFPYFCVTAFVNYVYQPVDLDHAHNLSGFKVGGGVGTRF
jgi:hypothetical protein